jgi:uncharacterized protein (TIGR02246 family)
LNNRRELVIALGAGALTPLNAVFDLSNDLRRGINMNWLTRFIYVLMVSLAPTAVFAGPAEDAGAVVDRWSAAYTSNEPEAVVKNYAPDAILLGTVSPVISEGTEAIRKYFSPLKGSGNKNVIGERRTILISENAVLVTGFYEFTSMVEGKPTVRPSRFTMLVTKRDGQWQISHHHSSPRVQPTK